MYRGVIIRGGTSKGIFFKAADMPKRRELWNDFLLDVMGSPDPRQIDGIGGANSLTSKAAIIDTSSRDDADIDYTFAQVGISDGVVDMRGNCGNLSSAAGVFAVHEGLISPKEGMMNVRIYNSNTNKIIINSFEVRSGRVVQEGNTRIHGVPGRGASIRVTFTDPGGAVTGKLLPTNHPSDKIKTSFNTMVISVVDAGNPFVFMRAEELGLAGTELPGDYSTEDLEKIEEVRQIAGNLCGIGVRDGSGSVSAAVPKAAVLAPPQRYSASDGEEFSPESFDILVRMMSMQTPHRALAVTGAVCINMANRIPGTLVHEIAGGTSDRVVLGHPGGTIESRYYEHGTQKGVTVLRTARVIMAGNLYTKRQY